MSLTIWQLFVFGITRLLVWEILNDIKARAVTRVISNLLFGVSATDPQVVVGVPLLLIAVALLATYLPARRAFESRSDRRTTRIIVFSLMTRGHSLFQLKRRR